MFKIDMKKLLCSFSFLILILSCQAQQRRTLLTKITSDRDTSQLLYTITAAGDSLVIDRNIVFMVKPAPKGVYFICEADTLYLTFQDQEKTIRIGKDIYRLYPDFYLQFKKAVLTNHSVIAVLKLLEDNIADYPIEQALMLTLFAPQTRKAIRSARISTQRSKSELIDVWNCVYSYDKNGLLQSVTAASTEETRFQKKMSYLNQKLTKMQLYRSIESRQITDRKIIYLSNSLIKWQQNVLETGKNRESEQSVTLKKSTK